MANWFSGANGSEGRNNPEFQARLTELQKLEKGKVYMAMKGDVPIMFFLKDDIQIKSEQTDFQPVIRVYYTEGSNDDDFEQGYRPIDSFAGANLNGIRIANEKDFKECSLLTENLVKDDGITEEVKKLMRANISANE